MAAALDSSILESSLDENGEIDDGKFKLKEFVMAEDKYSIVQDPTLNLIKATFWKNIYGIFPKSQIDGLEIVFDIKKIEVIFNKDFQDSYDVLKTDMNGNEIVVFQGVETYNRARDVAEHHTKLARTGHTSGIICYQNPMKALKNGLTLIAFKAVVPKTDAIEDSIYFMTKTQLLPIGIICLDFNIVSKRSKMDPNTDFMWKFISDKPLFEEAAIDVKVITKEIMNEIIRTCYSGECAGRKLNFRVNFIGAKTELREMVPQEDYNMIRDAERLEDPMKNAPISYNVVFHNDDALKFLGLFNLRTKISRKDLLTKIGVTFVVNHDVEIPAASLILKMFMHVDHPGDKINSRSVGLTFIKPTQLPISNAMKQMEDAEFISIPINPPLFVECFLCDKIENGLWIMIHCNCKFHEECLKDRKCFQICPKCHQGPKLEVKTQPELGTVHLTSNDERTVLYLKSNFEDGIQTLAHPNPGEPFKGRQLRIALPYTNDCLEIMNFLKFKLFNDRLLYTVNSQNQIVLEPFVTWILNRQDVGNNPKKNLYLLEAFFGKNDN